jgi:cupin 2 domain-containing protein
MAGFERGRLRGPEAAPERGESTQGLVESTGFSVEQILSGALESAVEYRQDHDEWLLVLAGGAELTVEGAPTRLSAGEWMLLRRGVPHRLDSTRPGTSWLVVRGPRLGDRQATSDAPTHGGP